MVGSGAGGNVGPRGPEAAGRTWRVAIEEMVYKGHGDEVVLLFYTSGTTSLPKGALLSHNNMLMMGKHLMAMLVQRGDAVIVVDLGLAAVSPELGGQDFRCIRNTCRKDRKF